VNVNFWDLMPLMGEILAKAEWLKQGNSVPVKWSKRKGEYRYVLEGTLRREKVD
jgi:TolB-like protein